MARDPSARTPSAPLRWALRSRVASRLLMWSLLAGGIGTLMVTLWEAKRDYDGVEARAAQVLRSFGEVVAPPLSESVWAFDREHMRLELESLVRLQDVSTAILSVPGQPDERAGEDKLSDELLQHTVELQHEHDGQLQTIGRLTLVQDLQQPRSQALRRWGERFGGNALVILLTALGSVLIYHAIVTRRLGALALQLRAVTPADLRQPPPPPPVPAGRADELDELAASIATLQATGHRALQLSDEKHALLEEREEIYRSIVSQAGDGIVLFDPASGRFVEFNDSSCALLGHSRDSFAGLTLIELVADRSPSELRQELDRLVASGRADLELRLRHRDGSSREIAVSQRTVHLRNRVLVTAVWRDVTQRNAAEAAVRDEQRAREQILESIPGLSFAIDRHGRLTFWNQAFEVATDCTHQALAGRPLHELFEAGQRGLVEQRLRLALDVGAATCEAEVLGRQAYFFSLQRVDIGGRVLVVGTGIDVSALRHAERELRQLNAELEQRVDQRTAALQAAGVRLQTTQLAMDSVGIGILWIAPGSGRISWANRFAAGFLGYTVDELQGLHLSDIDPSVSPQAIDAFARLLQRRGVMRMDTTQRARDGRLRPVEVTLNSDPGGPDRPALIIAFFTDIGARKEAEQALHQARLVSESASRAKSAFLAHMSHEIRTPLTAINGLAHLIRRGGLAPAQAARLDKLEAAGAHLLSVIDAILELSKIEAGKFALVREPLRIDAVLGDVVSMLHERAQAKGLQLETHTQDLPAQLLGDATRLQQALLNYLANAIKFTPSGRISLSVGLVEQGATDALLRFEVADTGVGIPAEVLPRLFNAFEQADNTTTRQYGGTGLGLAITRRLAQLMGGDAGVDSQPGVGSRFWFTARLDKPVLAASRDDGPRHESAEAVLKRTCSGRRVLLAEDDPVNREVAQDLLQQAGLVVDCAEDGLAAVAMAAASDYDLILLDMQMPGLDGLAAAQAIREQAGSAALPIIALTANAFEDNRQACRNAGMDDFIAKPAPPELLYAKVEHWLGRASEAARPVTPA